MKTILKYLSFICVLLIPACDSMKEASLDVDKELLEVPVNGGLQTISIKANGPWQVVTTPQPFFTVSPSSGEGDGSLTVNVSANPEARPLEGTVAVTCMAMGSSTTKNIKILQEAAAPRAEIKEWNPGEIPATGGNISYPMVTNMQWSAVCDADDVKVDFITKGAEVGKAGNFQVEIKVPANPQSADRIIHLSICNTLVLVNGAPEPVAVYEIHQAGQ